MIKIRVSKELFKNTPVYPILVLSNELGIEGAHELSLIISLRCSVFHVPVLFFRKIKEIIVNFRLEHGTWNSI